jgi:PAS domain S-box-containing protein
VLPEPNQSLTSLQDFQLLTDNLPQLICVSLPDGHPVYYNQRWYEYTGLDYEQLGTVGWDGMLHPEDSPRSLEAWQHALQAGEAYQIELRCRRHDGMYRWFLCQTSPQQNQQGEIIKWYSSCTDIHEQKLSQVALHEGQQEQAATEAERSHLYELFMQAPAGIALLEGPDLVYRMANQEYYKILGRTPQILGKPGRVAFPEGVEQGIWDLLDQLYASGEVYVGKEFRALIDMQGNGELTEQYYDFVFQPVKAQAGQVTGILVTALNVTSQVEARKGILERETYFRQMADNVPVMIWITRADGYCTYFNEQWYAYTGQQQEQALGSGWLEATHPEDAPMTTALFLEATAEQTPFSLRYRLRGQDGTYRWFMNRALPKFSASGTFEGYVGVVLDIHEQKQAEHALQESKERFQGAVAAMEGILWTNNAHGEMVGPQPGWAGLTGQSDEAYQGYGWASAVHPEDAPATVEAWNQAVASQQPFVFEHRVRKKNGQWGRFSIRAIPLLEEDGKIREWVGVHTEVTQQREAEEALQRLSQALAASNEELRASNQELSRSNLQLTRTNDDLDNFVYAASHDLKAPILNIEGLLKTLDRQLSPQTRQNPVVGQIYALLYGSVERFKTTIADLTQVARIGKEGEEDISAIALSEVLGEVLKDLAPQIEETGARIETQLDCRAVHFSRKNLKSVLYNLLSNAVKYRSPDRPLRVDITCGPEGTHQVLTVADNGLGMDMRQEEKIFGLFKRLHNHVEGTGIGLYIVKKMVENAGGKIAVESKVGEGSTFRVYFKG